MKTFFGLVTCGYNSLEFVSKNPKEKWHRFSEIKPFLGKIVDSQNYDSIPEDYCIHSESEWKAKAVKKPVGKLVRFGFPEYSAASYETVTLQFNPAGTGTMTLLQKPFDETFITYTGGTINKKMPSGRTKSRTSVVLGGTLWWQHTAKRPFKWTMSTDGKLTVTPTGVVTMNYKEWLDDTPDKTLWSSKSDSIMNRRMTENDLKYRHEDAIRRRAEFKKDSKEVAENVPEFTIDVKYLTKDELVGTLNGKTIYLNSGKKGLMDLYNPKLYQKLDKWRQIARAERTKGAEMRYNDVVRRLKLAIAKNKDIFGTSPDYYAYHISPYGSFTIDYFKPNELWTGVYSLTDDDKIETVYEAQEEPLKAPTARLDSLNNEIMAYKKDKMRSKVVKEYEKSFKRFNKRFSPEFSSRASLDAVLKEQNDFIKQQEETLRLLK